MAIYKNREVTIVSPTRRVNPPSTIQIQYADSTYETVTTSQVQFTEDEKKALLKNFPSEFENVTVVSSEDIKSVRSGIAPKESEPVKTTVAPVASNTNTVKAK